jgi:hypothetical protein
VIGYHFLQWPIYVQQFCFALFILINTLATKNFPMGRDLSLFSRLAHRHSGDDVSAECEPVPIEPPNVQKSEIRSFVTYLAKEFHVVSMRSVNNGIWVRTTPYKSNPFSSILYAFWWKGASVIFLGYHGEFEAKLGQGDISKLPAHLFKGDLQKDQERINKQVTAGIRSAFTHWRLGDFKLTKKALGLGGDSDTFHVSPEKAKGNRMRVRLGIGCSIFLMVLSLSQFWMEEISTPRDLIRMKEISLQEKDIRDFLNLLADPGVKGDHVRKTFRHLKVNGYTFPAVELYSPESLAMIREMFGEEFNNHLARSWGQAIDKQQRAYLEFMTQFQSYFPIKNFWSSPQMKSTDWIQILNRHEPKWNIIEKVNIKNPSWTHQLWTPIHPKGIHVLLLFLADQTDLKALDFQQARESLINHQYLDTNKPIAQYTPSSLRDMHGLFFLLDNRPFMDTWQALSILELISGLEFIDQEACIEGLLRHYYGKGRFYINNKKSRYKTIRRPSAENGARATWAVFHSLRILNALDQVDDLEEWQFLMPPHWKLKEIPEEGNWSTFAWKEIEAWCIQQEFREYLRTMKEN